jgi:4-amino-4-deoxy-L-arabinose transferase-like glycosyltransferase
MNKSLDEPAAPRSRLRQIHWLRWFALSAIIVIYLVLVVHLHPANFFGLSQDDTLYFSSAKAIADGQGYILPSVPGMPAATKYPILYPWILSWVWRWNPSFPSNLSSALTLNLAFGVAYLIAAFIFLRRLPGISNTAALVLTAVCAVNPTVLFLSANLMSDIPFAAVALSACIVAASANEKETPMRTTVFSGILSGLSILIRGMGVPVAAGLFVAIALRKGWRRAAVFAACILPFSIAFLWRSIFLTPKLPPVGASSCAQSWRMTWLYYTSYGGFWRADVFSNDVFWQTVASNLRSILVQPGLYFLKGTFIRPAILAVVLLIVLSAVAIRGVVRLADLAGWQPIHFALGFSVLPMLIWDYSIMGRFLIPFLPLLCAAIWTEVRQAVSQVGHTPGRSGGAERRIAAGFLCLSGAILFWGIGVSWWGEIQALARISGSRAALLDEKRAAYAWLEQKTAPNSRILAYEDASLFLYSGRQSLRPVIFSAAGVYRPHVLNSELACIVSSAKPLGANYWVVSDDDFFSEWEPARSRAHEREEEIERTIHPLFRSEHGGVRIYKLDSDGEPER